MTDPLRVLVVAAPKTGSHMLAAAIHKSYGPVDFVRLGYDLAIHGWPTARSWVVATHTPYSGEMQRAADDRNVRIIGLDRHIAGHLLSYFGEIDLGTVDYGHLSTSSFGHARNLVHRIPDDLRVSYDELADPTSPHHDEECRRVAHILGRDHPVAIPTWGETRILSASAANRRWVIGDPHRWRRIFTDEQVSALSTALSGAQHELC